ncbi:MAG: hypothetical protein M3Q23_08125 [Actinomycetota bacterium]|nr:hypothetical protein [Actinomycetota bacterium]
MDVENTLTGYRPTASQVRAAVQRLTGALGEPGPRLILTSNSRRMPATSLGLSPLVGWIPRARKPWGKELRGLYKRLQGTRTVVAGDQPLTDGMVAWLLRAPFVYQDLAASDEQLWPRLIRSIGDHVIIKFMVRQVDADRLIEALCASHV